MTKKTRRRGGRNELVVSPLQQVAEMQTEWGAAMKALPSDRHRAFVLALFQVKPGHGAKVRAARLAGFGLPESTIGTMATIASRLAHSPNILAAIREHSENFISSSSPSALHALMDLIATPTHKDHARAIDMLIQRTHPIETTHTVKVSHDATPELRATTEVLERIAALALRAGINPARLPPIIEGRANAIADQSKPESAA